MSDESKQIPPYFKEYLELKFKELHNAIAINKEEHTKDILDINQKTKEYDTKIKILEEENVRFKNDKKWIWIIISAIIFSGGTLGFLLKFWVEQSVKTWSTEAVFDAINQKVLSAETANKKILK